MPEVNGRSVHFPVQVRDASAGTATFLADWAATRALLPPGLVPVRIGPGRTLVTLVMVDYRDNDLGAYHEAAIQLVVTRDRVADRVAGVVRTVRGRPETFTVAMPVDQEFSRAAGQELWGFPKTLDDVKVEVGPSRARCTWYADGEHVLTMSVPVGRERRLPAPPLVAWTVLDGRLHRTEFQMQAEHGRLGLGDVELTLGTHPRSGQLAALGLPKRAMLTTWMDDVTATFGAPTPVD